MRDIKEIQLYKPRKRKALKRPRTKNVANVKKVSLSKLKKALDAVFSRYVRALHPPTCFTCGKKSEAKKLQCGHFVPRIYLATRWDLNNCRPQCVGCNIWGRGQLLDFEDNLVQELGIEAVRDLKMKRLLIWKLNAHWYEAEIARYTELLSKLS